MLKPSREGAATRVPRAESLKSLPRRSQSHHDGRDDATETRDAHDRGEDANGSSSLLSESQESSSSSSSPTPTSDAERRDERSQRHGLDDLFRRRSSREEARQSRQRRQPRIHKDRDDQPGNRVDGDGDGDSDGGTDADTADRAEKAAMYREQLARTKSGFQRGRQHDPKKNGTNVTTGRKKEKKRKISHENVDDDMRDKKKKKDDTSGRIDPDGDHQKPQKEKKRPRSRSQSLFTVDMEAAPALAEAPTSRGSTNTDVNAANAREPPLKDYDPLILSRAQDNSRDASQAIEVLKSLVEGSTEGKALVDTAKTLASSAAFLWAHLRMLERAGYLKLSHSLRVPDVETCTMEGNLFDAEVVQIKDTMAGTWKVYERYMILTGVPEAVRKLAENSKEVKSCVDVGTGFHGTQGYNVLGILQRGIDECIDTAKSEGGKTYPGCYFSNMVHCASGYCGETHRGCIFECDIRNIVKSFRNHSKDIMQRYYTHLVVPKPFVTLKCLHVWLK